MAQGRACPRDASNRLPVGLHPSPPCARTPATTSPGCRASPRMDLFLAHFADTLAGCARRMMCDGAGWHDRARPHRPRNDLGAVAALQSRTQPRRAGLALYEHAPCLRDPRRPEANRRLLPSMDRPHSRPDRMRTLCATITLQSKPCQLELHVLQMGKLARQLNYVVEHAPFYAINSPPWGLNRTTSIHWRI